ncbi:MAG TPA: ribonuclease HII [Armatimonadota bacterium]|nr:ribonuclease HII [Armatimonadota bacterium]
MREDRKSADLWFYERMALAQGHCMIVGVDEAGRGPLAGPVVAAAVVLPFDCDIDGIRDSKQLSPRKREAAFEKIYGLALSIGIGIVEQNEIDRMNILQATYRAMRGAISGLDVQVDVVLVDGYPIRDFDLLQMGIVSGDTKSASIAAASIVAKVTRDRIMCKFDRIFPQYGFAGHKGYSTEEHLEKLAAHGVCEIHRRSFAPVARELGLR